MKLIALIALLSAQIMAGINQAPSPFSTKFGRAVFVDFQSAEYDLIFNHKEQIAYADTTIVFDTNDEGLPIFDSVSTPQAIWVNGEEVSQEEVYVPGGVSKVRVANAIVAPGKHTMRIRSTIDKGVSFGGKGVSAGFFIKDLKDRMFLERYVPTNYEYDQYKMTFRVKVEGADHRWHDIFANGEVVNSSQNTFEITYPDFYTSSSVYFHLVPRRKYVRYYLEYTSINGRTFPVTIYSHWRFLNRYLKRKAWTVLQELEKDFGPWPHPRLIIYGTGIRGGMEYVGATATSLVSLGHELFHSYFAKGVMPADGNSGWMDEGLASWRDKGYQSHEAPNYYSVNLAKHNKYTRKTDKRSYVKGRSFFAYIDYQLKAKGLAGLKDFLALYFVKRRFTTVTTEDLISDLENYAQASFREDFNQYIFGGHASSTGRSPAIVPENPHHPEYTDQELESIL
ncbi:MAG: hypothetical protein KC478_12020 [Bacteriovoracaceae bacterium]|nr:hypothetical protein [Bacteriovoracaceae bacterium]